MPGVHGPVIDFSTLLAERTRGFAGRQWVFQAVDEWLADDHATPVFLLTGEPGAGKSAIAARLALISASEMPPPLRTAQLTAGFLSAVHFCSANDGRWINPHVFAESLARQLSDRHPRYAQALLEIVAPTITIQQQARENWGRMVGAQIGTVVMANAEDLFNRIVREPLEVLARDRDIRPVIVLVDALDESLAYTGTVTIADLVTQTGNLPRAVRFLVTCRPTAALVRALQRRSATQYTLSPRPEHGNGPQDPYAHVLSDVQDYIEDVMREKGAMLAGRLAPTLSAGQFVAAIRDRSEGNFLYVRYLLPMLFEQRGPITVDSLAALPTGLDKIYLDFVQRLVPAKTLQWSGRYARILGVLAVGQVPLTEEQIARFAALDPGDTRLALGKLGELLETDVSQSASARRYSLYHKSLAEFLLDRDSAEEYSLDEAALHRMIADRYWGLRASGWRTCDDYGLRYLATHLSAGRELTRLQSLIDLNWIRVRSEHRRYSYDGIVDDIDVAWRAAELEDRAGIAVGRRAGYIAEGVRWALSLSSIGSVLRHIPADLPSELVRDGEWSPVQGLAYARRVPAGEPRSRALATLAAHLPQPLRPDTFAESIAAARQITDAEGRAATLTWLLPRLPGELRREAFVEAIAAVRELTDRERVAGGYRGYYGSGEGERYADTGTRTAAVTALGAVLVGLSRPSLGQEDIIRLIGNVCAESDERWRAAATDLISRFAGSVVIEDRRRYSGACGPSVASITAKSRIGDAAELATFAATFAGAPADDPDGEWAAQLAALRGVPSPYFQAARLAALAARLPTAVLGDAVDVALSLQRAHARARALGCLAPHLPQAKLRIVLDRVQPDDRGVADILAAIVGYLPEELVQQAYARAAALVDDTERASALAVLASWLPEPVAHDALTVVRQVITTPVAEEWGRPEGLARLAAHLPDALAVEGFAALRELMTRFYYHRPPLFMVPALLALARQLPEPHRGDAVSMVREAGGVDLRYGGGDNEIELVARSLDQARRLSASPESEQLLRTLATWTLSEAKEAVYGRGYPSWNLRHRIGLMINLLPHLPEPYLTEAATTTVKWIVEESADRLPPDQTATLGAYLPEALLAEAEGALTYGALPSYLPDELVPAALDVARIRKNKEWLLAAAARAQPDLLGKALQAAQELGGAALRAELMASRCQLFTRLPADILYAHWSDTLRAMANLDRPVFLVHLAQLGPVVATLGGSTAVNGVRLAVDQIVAWWP